MVTTATTNKGTTNKTKLLIRLGNPVGEIYLTKSPNASDNFYDTKNPPGLNIQYEGDPVVDNPKLKVQVVATFGSSKTAIVITELMKEDQLIR